MGSLKQKQKKLKRDYMKLYKKLDMYGQAPVNPINHPWQRDIERLKARWETVKSYARTYRNYEKAVNQFNAEYSQALHIREPHTRMNTATIETLKQEYMEFRKQRNKFIKSVQSEVDIIDNHIKDMLRTAYDYAQPTHYTSAGEFTPHQLSVITSARKFESFYNSVITNTGMKRVISNWESYVNSINKFIFDSDEDIVSEAWAVIVSLLTNNTMSYTDMEYGDIDI